VIPNDDRSIEGISEYLEEHLDSTTTYIVGPGRTTQKFMERIGISGTLLGIDVLRDKELIGRDVNHQQLNDFSKDDPLCIIVGIIGGQGFLFGRGNQQITADIIRRVRKNNILVVASSEKIFSLNRQCLLVDTGDTALDNELAGYIKVRTAKYQTFVVQIKAA
jgi:predicted polyphosphate/ATP-dependent NAD kinase